MCVRCVFGVMHSFAVKLEYVTYFYVHCDNWEWESKSKQMVTPQALRLPSKPVVHVCLLCASVCESVEFILCEQIMFSALFHVMIQRLLAFTLHNNRQVKMGSLTLPLSRVANCRQLSSALLFIRAASAQLTLLLSTRLFSFSFYSADELHATDEIPIETCRRTKPFAHFLHHRPFLGRWNCNPFLLSSVKRTKFLVQLHNAFTNRMGIYRVVKIWIAIQCTVGPERELRTTKEMRWNERSGFIVPALPLIVYVK